MPAQLLGSLPTDFDSLSLSLSLSLRQRRITRGVIAGVAALVLLGGTASAASAATGDASRDTTVANVQVSNAIVLSGLTPSFTLVGVPGATVSGESEVAMTVTTNNLAGYSVTVQSSTATLLATTAGNLDSIPIGDLGVREHAAGDAASTSGFTALSSTSPVTVRSKATRSATAGDAFTNDYRVTIPFVNEDTYSATLNYIATAL